jgi:hypothetical protein
MYQAYLLLEPANDFSLAAAADRLAEKFPGFAVTRTNDGLVLSSEDWEIGLRMNSGPEVLEESQRIAEHVSGQDDGRDIASIDRRVEIASDVPDPEMDHFNDYLMVIETLQTFRGVIAVDPTEPSLL